MKKLSIVLKYLFREHTLYCQIFTAIAILSLLGFGYQAYAVIFWLKVVGFVAVSVLWHWFRSQHLYFFHNLGYGIRKLILLAWLVDWSVSIPLLLITKVFRT